MRNIIVAYPTKDMAMQLRNVLEHNGLYVSHVCGTGSSALGIAADMRSGVIVTASILRDMSAGTLAERLPAGFDIVALSKGGREEYMGNLISLPLPLNKAEFIKTVEVLVATETSFTDRTADDKQIISNAKAILMNVNNMTEMQAHKYLQSESMKRSKKMVDIANEVIYKFNDR